MQLQFRIRQGRKGARGNATATPLFRLRGCGARCCCSISSPGKSLNPDLLTVGWTEKLGEQDLEENHISFGGEYVIGSVPLGAVSVCRPAERRGDHLCRGDLYPECSNPALRSLP